MKPARAKRPPNRGPAASASPAGLTVTFIDRQRKHRLRRAEILRVLEGAAGALRVEGELALVFAGDALLHRLNRDYRGKDKPTDVLSFESQGEDMGLGDVFISVETARANAVLWGRSLDRELEILALHGFLHALGYDHETDDGEMEALEKRLRAKLLTRATPPSARRRAA